MSVIVHKRVVSQIYFKMRSKNSIAHHFYVDSIMQGNKALKELQNQTILTRNFLIKTAILIRANVVNPYKHTYPETLFSDDQSCNGIIMTGLPNLPLCSHPFEGKVWTIRQHTTYYGLCGDFQNQEK